MDTNNSMEENVRLSALLSWVSADEFKIRLYSSEQKQNPEQTRVRRAGTPRHIWTDYPN